MSEMVERATRAAQEANVNGSKYDLTDHYAEAIVRAVIKSMEVPTEAMISAANDLPITKDINGAVVLAQAHGMKITWTEEDLPLKQWWRGMIIEALGRGTER